MARATPPDSREMLRDTSTGAACARLVVNTAAAVAGRVGHEQREVEAAVWP